MIQEKEIFLNTNDFAQAAVFTPTGGSAANCKVNFIDEGELVPVGDVFVPTDKPQAEILTSVAGSAKSGTLKIGTVTWYVIDAGPDKDGFTMLSLSRSPKS